MTDRTCCCHRDNLSSRWRAMSRRAATCLLVLSSGCSIGVRGLPPTWDGRSEPECEGRLLVGLDEAMAGALLSTALGIAITGADTGDEGSNAQATGAKPADHAALVGTAFLVWGLTHLLVGAAGAHRLTLCEEAHVRWASGEDEPSATVAEAPPSPAPAPSGPQPSDPALAGFTQPSAPPPTGSGPRPWAQGVTSADQAAALALYDAGNAAFVVAHHAQALEKYREAIRHWDHPAIRFNMAVCLINLDQLVEARTHLERGMVYGEAPLGPEVYTQGVTYRALLDAQLVRLTIDGPESTSDVALDGKHVFRGPGVVDTFALPGEHMVVATKPGFLPASQRITLVRGRPTRLRIRPQVDRRLKP